MRPQHERIDVAAPSPSPMRASALLEDMLRMEEMAHQEDCNDEYLLRHHRHHNEIWREKVAQWCYRVIDHIGEERDAVYLTMNVLDRFLATNNNKARTSDVQAYQVAAMTALLLVVRFRGKVESFGAKDLLRMSRGNVVISPQDIARTAKEMAECITWRNVHLPSPSKFVRSLLELIRPREQQGVVVGMQDTQDDVWSAILDDATYLVEISVCDSYFSAKSSSVLAYAAIQYAIDRQVASSKLSSTARASCLDWIEGVTGLRRDSEEIRAVHSRLVDVYSQSSDVGTSNDGSSSGSSSSGSRDKSKGQNRRMPQQQQPTARPVVIPCDEDEVEDEVVSYAIKSVSCQENEPPVTTRAPQDVVKFQGMKRVPAFAEFQGMKRVPTYTSLVDPPTKRRRLCQV